MTVLRIFLFFAAGATVFCTIFYGQAARRMIAGSREGANQSRGTAHLSFMYEESRTSYSKPLPSAPPREHGHGNVIATATIDKEEHQITHHDRFGKCLWINGRRSSCSGDEGIHGEGLVHPAMLLHPFPRKVLVLGNPEGTVVREVLRYFTIAGVVWAGGSDEAVEFCQGHLPYRFEDVLGLVERVPGGVVEYFQRDTRNAFDVIIVEWGGDERRDEEGGGRVGGGEVAPGWCSRGRGRQDRYGGFEIVGYVFFPPPAFQTRVYGCAVSSLGFLDACLSLCYLIGLHSLPCSSSPILHRRLAGPTSSG